MQRSNGYRLADRTRVVESVNIERIRVGIVNLAGIPETAMYLKTDDGNIHPLTPVTDIDTEKALIEVWSADLEDSSVITYAYLSA